MAVFDLVKEVDLLDSGDAAHLALMARPDLGVTFTKLHSWKLTQFSKCVFLDADTMVRMERVSPVLAGSSGALGNNLPEIRITDGRIDGVEFVFDNTNTRLYLNKLYK